MERRSRRKGKMRRRRRGEEEPTVLLRVYGDSERLEPLHKGHGDVASAHVFPLQSVTVIVHLHTPLVLRLHC